MPVVSNSSPLIALAEIELLSLLAELFESVLIPPAVAAEIAPTISRTPLGCASRPAGKLADVELHFHDASPLAGLKLIGFSVWERRGGTGRNVTFPARAYSVNGERRSFALLRPIVDATAQNAIRDRILEAYADYEAQVTVADA